MKHKILTLTLLASLSPTLWGQGGLTLEACRERALRGNHSLKQADEKRLETEALEKVALWQMLPKVSANGTYLWMDKSVNLLNDEQKERISNMGTTVQGDINEHVRQELHNLPLGGDAIAQWLTGLLSGLPLEGGLNNLGQEVVQGLETDTRNMFAGLVTVTQPVYMGGKLRALHRTAALLNSLSNVEYDKKREATLIAVDEAFWQVVSVQHKKELAEQYAALLDTLNHNVEQMVEAEVATKGDLAKVRVKLNEAQMSLTKATNGLTLAKMLLAQRCGMPLDTLFEVSVGGSGGPLADGAHGSLALAPRPQPDMDSVYANRAEMKMLRISDSVAQQGIRMATSTLLDRKSVV